MGCVGCRWSLNVPHTFRAEPARRWSEVLGLLNRRLLILLKLGLNVGRIQAVGVRDGVETCCWGLSGHCGWAVGAAVSWRLSSTNFMSRVKVSE